MALRKNEKQTAKERWRYTLKSLLQKESPFSSAQIQTHLNDNLMQYLQGRQGTWAGYHALPQEPDLSVVYRHMPTVRWAFPRMESQKLNFYISQHFIKGPFGVMEPSGDTERVEVDGLQGILVPGLGFSKRGHRLGRGKGYYDRALQDYQGLKIGVCFACQVAEEDLPEEGHDVRVDVIVTEDDVIGCGKF